MGVALFSSLKLDTQVVDFHRPTGDNGTHPDMFAWIENYFRGQRADTPPLYLQHQGHSRTVVGVERWGQGAIKLLVLDPSHAKTQMSGMVAADGLKAVRKTLAAMRSRQYQVVAVTGVITSDRQLQQKKQIVSVRVPPT